MRYWCLVVVACSSPAGPREPITGRAGLDDPQVELVAVNGTVLRRLEASLAGGVRETSAVTAPSRIVELAWAGREPVVRLVDHRVGVVTARGLELLALPPASTWSQSKPRDGAEHLEPRWRVFTRSAEIWLGRCEWGEKTAFEFCESWVDVRLRPAPIAIERGNGLMETVTPIRDIVKPTPPIAPSTSIHARLVTDTRRPDVSNGTTENHPRQKLECTANGKTIEDPPADAKLDDEYGNGGRSDLVWISTEPPVFQIGIWDGCYAMCPNMVTYEGCKVSDRFARTALVLGPSEVLALVNERSAGDAESKRSSAVLLWRGRELGTVVDVTFFEFVPAR